MAQPAGNVPQVFVLCGGRGHQANMWPLADIHQKKFRPILIRLVQLVQACELAAKNLAAETTKEQHDWLLAAEIRETDLVSIDGVRQGKFRGLRSYRKRRSI